MSEGSGPAVLVTGGAGFIGSHLVEALLHRGAQITILDNLSSGSQANLAGVIDRVDLRRLDLRCDDLRPLLAERGFETIFHLAGNADIPFSVQHPRQDFETNLVTTLNLLEAVREASPPARLIFASSATVYGGASVVPQTEDSPTVPIAPYGVSKLAAERYVAVYARLHGLRTASVRLFSMFGPRLHKQVVYDLMCKIQENPRELFIHGDGTQTRPLTYVADAVQALLVVAQGAALQGEVYNVAGKDTVSIGHLAEMICQRMGVKPRFVYSGSVRPGDAEHWDADISRIKALGYRPYTSLAEGLAETVAWFRREHRTTSALERREAAP
jgi:UDP-glucose 4-epimerase